MSQSVTCESVEVSKSINDKVQDEPSQQQSVSTSGDGQEKPKTEAQKRKDAKKAEKDAKYQAKLQKLKENQAVANATHCKEEKKKIREVTKYDRIIEEGAEKDVSDPMPASYSPDYVEACWYAWWKRSGFFKPEINAPRGKISHNRFYLF